ncbi:DUF5392 family protein [Bacillaceae bacterium Marseille-Q3522]|nr:DUF5392 family protein [Bacillaceae bacterium Marseille-Q3522]
MDLKSVKKLPEFIQVEIDNLQKQVSPLLKRNFSFTLIAALLVSSSLVNLFFMLFIEKAGFDQALILGLFAILGAAGFAFFKESRVVKKAILIRSQQYILKRIHNSSVLPETRKNNYVKWIKAQPFSSMNLFFEFLKEEEQRKQRLA